MIRTWTEKWPDGCRWCHTKTRKHHGQGYCTKCYRKAQDRKGLQPVTRRAMRRRFNGETQFFCHVCSRWKSESQYTNAKMRTVCNECHTALRRERYAARRDELNEIRRAQYAETMQAIRKADKKRAKSGDPWGKGKIVVPRELVTAWLDVALLLYDGVLSDVANAMGVHEKRLRSIRDDTAQGVTVDVAENIATVAGKTQELREFLEPGVANWSRAGHRFCQRCGRYDVPHAAKGYCRRCYCNVWWHAQHGNEPTLPRGERWSLRHMFCVMCGRNKLKHQGHGVCSGCYQKWRRNR